MMGRASPTAPQRPTGDVAANTLPASPIEAAPSQQVRAALAVAGVGIVKTDPAVLAALAPGRAQVPRLGDAELQEALRAAGEPAGIVRVGQRVITQMELEEDVGDEPS
jgi:hypothetical protein